MHEEYINHIFPHSFLVNFPHTYMASAASEGTRAHAVGFSVLVLLAQAIVLAEIVTVI